MLSFRKHLCLLALPVVAGTAAVAQPEDIAPSAAFSGAAAFQGSTEVDMKNGDTFQWSRSYFQASGMIAQSRVSSVGIEIGGGQTNYSFGSGFVGRSSIDVNELKVSFPIRFPVGERSAAFIVPQINYAAESGADLSDGFTYGAIGGIMWRVSPDLVIGPAMGVQTSLLDETVFFPFLLIDWQFSDRWRLATGSGFAASRGAGLRLAFEATDTWELGLETRYEEFEFLLDDSHGRAGGTGVDSSTPIVLTSRWTPSDTLTITGFAGAAVNGQFKFEDANGNEVSQSDYDPAPIFGLLARLEF